MIDRLPPRLRAGFGAPGERVPNVEMTMAAATPDVVDFVAYGEDCVLSGRTVLDGDRLSDMLNAHDEYALMGVTVERYDGGPPIAIDDVVVGKDELWLVHAGQPRGAVGRRMPTTPQHMAIKMGQYQVRGFIHSRPGSDPVADISRRKSMVPITNARIAYTMLGEEVEVRVATLIVNRDRIDWLQAIEPDRAEFPTEPKRATIGPEQPATDHH